jgi:hypothetical protein
MGFVPKVRFAGRQQGDFVEHGAEVARTRAAHHDGDLCQRRWRRGAEHRRAHVVIEADDPIKTDLIVPPAALRCVTAIYPEEVMVPEAPRQNSAGVDRAQGKWLFHPEHIADSQAEEKEQHDADATLQSGAEL